MKTKLFLPLTLITLSFSGELSFGKVGCTIAKVISRDVVTQAKLYSSAFAYNEHTLIVNDHSLAEDSQTVELVIGGNKVTGFVKGRDFNTDLAAIQVPDMKLDGCTLSTEPVKTVDLVEMAGIEKEDISLSEQTGLVKNAKSQKMMIPGIYEAIEVAGAGGHPLSIRESSSGSALFINDKVIGMIAQETREGSGLAIPAKQIVKMAPILLADGKDLGLPYKYNHRDKSFEFRGLELRPQDQMKRDNSNDDLDGKSFENKKQNSNSQDIKNLRDLKGGNPHEGKDGNPHEGMRGEIHIGAYSPDQTTRAVALEDYELGYAVAKIKDLKALRKYQPELAQVLASQQTKEVYISSIDGMRIASLFELIRALGTCQSCIIDGFWIASDHPETIENQSMRAISLMTTLLTSLESERGGVNFVRSLMPDLEPMNRLWAQAARAEERGLKNPKLIQEMNQQWDRIENRLAKKVLSDESRDLLNAIRLLNPLE